MRHSNFKIEGGKVFGQYPRKTAFYMLTKTIEFKGDNPMKKDCLNTTDFDFLKSLCDFRDNLTLEEYIYFLSDLEGYVEFIKASESFCSEKIAPLQSFPTYLQYCELWSEFLEIFAESSGISFENNEGLLKFLEGVLSRKINFAVLKNSDKL